MSAVLPGKTVLLAEDEPLVAEPLIRWLEGFGCTVAWAQDGREALEWARARAPDIALIDVRLPGLDGFQLIRELRQGCGYHSLPMISITANRSPFEARAALAIGADAQLGKPFEISALVALMERLLGAGDPDRPGRRDGAVE